VKTNTILPADRYGNIYYGPRTFKEVKAIVDQDAATPRKMYELLKGAGLAGVAGKIKKYYGL